MTNEERLEEQALHAMGRLVSEDVMLDTEEYLAFESGDYERVRQIMARKAELLPMILDAEAEYLRRKIAAQEVYRKLMLGMLDSEVNKSPEVALQAQSMIANMRDGINNEVDKEIDKLELQLQDNRERRSQLEKP